jgi:uncharacterized protein YkwD
MRRCLLALALLSAVVADAQTEKGKFKLTAAEEKLLELVNKSRAREKLPPLKPNAVLFKIARAHAANMARQEKMAHVLDGKNPIQRALDGGYNYRFLAENVAKSEGEDVKLEDVHKDWLKSKHHRDNILSPKPREIGLGLARNKKGETYYAQLFGSQRRRR